MNNKEYVKKFAKITLSDICKRNNLCKQNISSGTASEENYKIVKEEIESEIAKLYIKE